LALVSEANIAGKTIVTYNLHQESKGDDQLRRFQLAEVLDVAGGRGCKRPDLWNGDVSFGCLAHRMNKFVLRLAVVQL
jgi:hypothetical protein